MANSKYIGKERLSVDNGNVAIAPFDLEQQIHDPIRKLLGKYYRNENPDNSNSSITYNNPDDFFEYTTPNGDVVRIDISYADAVTQKEAREVDPIRCNEHGTCNEDILEESPFGTSQRIKLHFSVVSFHTPEVWGDPGPGAARAVILDEVLRIGNLLQLTGAGKERRAKLVVRDSVFRMQLPFEQELEEVRALSGATNRISFVKFNPVYNFFSKKYEEVLQEFDIHHVNNILPNLYILTDVTDSFNDNKKPQSKLLQHATLNGNISKNILSGQIAKPPGFGPHGGEEQKFAPLKKPGTSTRDYFEQWARELNRPQNTRNLLGDFSDQFRNIIIGRSEVEEFDSILKKRFLYPMYTEIEFSTQTNTQIAEILKNSQLDSLLIRDVVETNPDMEHAFVDSTVVHKTVKNLDEVSRNLISRRVRHSQLRMWDVMEWWRQRVNTIDENGKVRSNLDEDFLNFSSLDFGVLIGELFSDINENPQSRFLRNILTLVFGLGLKKLIKNNLRTAEDIMNGVPAYSETVFYAIQKGSGTNKQTIYLPNSNDVDIMRYVDTQVSYAKTQNYKILAYQLVIGSDYEYSAMLAPSEAPAQVDPGEGEAEEEPLDPAVQAYVDAAAARGHVISPNIQVLAPADRFNLDAPLPPLPPITAAASSDEIEIDLRQVPRIHLIETEYVGDRTYTIFDKPPVHPDVNIVPYKNVKNQILIWLNGEIGDYKESPVIIEEEDMIEVEQHLGGYISPTMVDEFERDGWPPIHYRTDDSVEAFEVFRIDEKPLAGKEYESFRGHKHAVISTNETSSGAFVDKLKPNRKYYYTFRARDKKGHISNPTSIYEVELVENSGAIYPLINTVVIFREKKRVPSKSMRKYIQIRPSFQQRLTSDILTEVGLPTEDRSINLSEISLGKASPQVWDKKFKFRFKSKKTRKMFDLNLTFKRRNINE